MNGPKAPKERTIPAPLVLALASAMVAIGAVAYLANRARAPRPEAPHRVADARAHATFYDASEVGAAETYLDAWRKRDHEAAARISIGSAHGEALARRDAENRMQPADRESSARIWNEMAKDRLHFVVENRRTIDPSHAYLEGRAEGRFLGQPYARRAGFEVVTEANHFRVARMDLGPELEAADAGRGDRSP